MASYTYNDKYTPIENIAFALYAIASELSALGYGSCSNPNGHGAVENLAIIMRDGFKDISESIGCISDSIENGTSSRTKPG